MSRMLFARQGTLSRLRLDAVFILLLALWLCLGSFIKCDSSYGLYLENCFKVQYDPFGHLEVISSKGAQVLTSCWRNATQRLFHVPMTDAIGRKTAA